MSWQKMRLRPESQAKKAFVYVAKPWLIIGLCLLLGLFFPVNSARGQTGTASTTLAANSVPPPSAPAKLSAPELEKLAMPIALHPDPLIAVMLPAACYPLEIVQAARFVKDTNNIPNVDAQPWDENVKALAKYPELIAKMDADLAWTIQLGQAFIDQRKELMDTIQDLRSKAQKAGNLKTTPQQIVTVTNVVVQQTNVTQVVNVTKEVIQIEPASPSVVYVPSYPPAIYYPWYPYYPYAAPLVSFGVGFAWGAFWGAAWNHCNWGHGDVDVDINSNRNVNRNRSSNRQTGRVNDRMNNRSGSNRQSWKADQNRMRQKGANPSTRQARGFDSGGARASTGNVGARASSGNLGGRPSTGNVGARPAAANTSARSTRPSTSQASSRSSSGSSAFNRSSGSRSAWSSSNRGSSSRGGGGFSRGGGGGGRGGGRRR